MLRKYCNTETPTTSDYFVASEVEKTFLYGSKTLFVVGLKPMDEITAIAYEQGIRHIYLGANKSFQPKNDEDLVQWKELVTKLQYQDYWVTLDFHYKYLKDVEDLLLFEETEFNKFIPLISLPLPNIRKYNHLTYIKLDDPGFAETNPGVWVHPVRELLDVQRFTCWDEYANDTVLDIVENFDDLQK